jgi:protein-L-isoaspartate(D-aspartate) O-methyltransferase
MLDAIEPHADDRALEIGTGFGFQTALLAHLVEHVVSVERWESLAVAARDRLTRTGITNATVVVGDGWEGAPAHAPFDVVVVSAAATEVPEALTAQLVDGGRMVIPVKAERGEDVLLFEKEPGRLRRVRLVTPARFVPLVRGAAPERRSS